MHIETTRKLFHRTSFKRKFFIALTILFSFYIFFINDSFLLNHLKVHLLYIGNFSKDGAPYEHQFGQFITNHNGTFMFFHLPNLSDFNIERDFHKLNSLGADAKYCLRNGADMGEFKADNFIFCVCKSDYIGHECAIPPLVHKTVDTKFSSQISRLGRPRRLLLSLIWFTYDYDRNNDTSKQARLVRFSRAFDRMVQFVDLFIVHEVRLVPSTNLTLIEEDEYSLEHQFKQGVLSKYRLYTLLYSNVIIYNVSSTSWKLDMRRLETNLMRKSWDVFTNHVTEYRPADFLIFLSANNFVSESLLLYLKYHTGLMDITHLKPIYNTTFFIEDDALQVTSELTTVPPSAIDSRMPEPTNSHGSYHLKNVIITFEFISYLCQYSFEDFLSNNCLADQKVVDQFQKNFWPIHFVNVGDEKLNLSSTFSIL